MKKGTLDPLKKLKLYGYYRSHLPENMTFENLVNHAKFTLCRKTNRLWKDPIWDEYTDEEIMAEFYSHSFLDNDEFRHEFEANNLSGRAVYGDDYDWILQKSRELEEENKQKLEELPDKVSFSPETGEDVED